MGNITSDGTYVTLFRKNLDLTFCKNKAIKILSFIFLTLKFNTEKFLKKAIQQFI